MLSRPQGHSAAGRIRSIEKSTDLIGNRTHNIPACSIVPQLTTLPRALYIHYLIKSIRTHTRNCNPTFPVTFFPAVDINTEWAHPLSLWQLDLCWGGFLPGVWMSPVEWQLNSSCRAVARAVSVVGCWGLSEVGVLIHHTGVLWDSGQDFGLASPFLEPYCPQTTVIVLLSTEVFPRVGRQNVTDAWDNWSYDEGGSMTFPFRA
jgi:hypothetical protein